MSQSRGPLLARPPPHQSPSHPGRIIRSPNSSGKRTRSPEPSNEARLKRVKPSTHTNTPTRKEDRPERDERRIEREARDAEFRSKYRKAFPTWVFHFAADAASNPEVDDLKANLEMLGARVEDFYSADITHLITDVSLPPASSQPSLVSTTDNKENASKLRSAMQRTASHMKSTLNGKAKAVDEASYPRATVLNKALEFGQKIWAVNKLKSVLERTFLPGERNELPGPSRPRPQTKSLTSLLAAERLHGTSERDPTQKRHDFRYFSKNSYFVLVEDMRQDLAIISAMEYPITKNKDGTERGTWPTLHCHPRARGPFIPYDEKEEKRFEKQELMLKQREGERIKAKTRLKQGFKRQAAKADPTVEGEEKGSTNLRRTQSMSNLHREDSLPEVTVADGTGIYESAHASGFLASGAWVAASGNSVAITSTTGTTSNAGMYNRDMPLPAKLQGSLHREVLMRRNSVVEGEAGPSNGPMGPPALPDRKKATLRKSRSTNTIKLPMRRENSKPGFCESCRVKFDDFTQHVTKARHRKFATDPANFVQLDTVLSRVRRRTTAEVEAEYAQWLDQDQDDLQYEDDTYDGCGIATDEALIEDAETTPV